MNEWQYIVISAIVAAIAYLFVSGQKQGNAVASIEGKINQLFNNQLEMKQSQEDIREEQKALDQKLDLFLKNEIDILKEIARQGFTRNKD
jgi:hypothetical protein